VKVVVKLQLGVSDVETSDPPSCYEVEYQTLLTPEAVKFVAELVRQFNKNVDKVHDYPVNLVNKYKSI